MARRNNVLNLEAFTDINSLFTSEEERQILEGIRGISLSELHPFPNHPYQVRDDEEMAQLIEGIRQNGVIMPALVRPMPDGSEGYQIISGHRRVHACEHLGIDKIPAIVRHMDDDLAVIMMVDSNCQRENIRPSEKARAYKMKMDALGRSGRRTDLATCGHNGHKSDTEPNETDISTCDHNGHRLSGRKTRELIGQKFGDSGTKVQRYIRLTELIPELLNAVDNRKLHLLAGVELSYISPENQKVIYAGIDDAGAYPSVTQAQAFRAAAQSSDLIFEDVVKTLNTKEMRQSSSIKVNMEVIRDRVNPKMHDFLFKNSTPRQKEELVVTAINSYSQQIDIEQRFFGKVRNSSGEKMTPEEKWSIIEQALTEYYERHSSKSMEQRTYRAQER